MRSVPSPADGDPPMIEAAHVDAFQRDGAVCVRGAVDAEWIESLTQGVEQNIDNPTERGRLWNRDELGRSSFYDSQAWQGIPQYRRFIEHGPLAGYAAALTRSTTVNFFFDAIFVRTPGAQFRTPFHQDEPYWSVEGFDTCSAWMPLVPVEKASALEFVAGSHRWPERFRQTNFGALTGDERDQVAFSDTDTVPFPDIEADRDRYTMLSWDMEPGDVAFFNGRTIHGGSGNLRADRGLKVFNTKWLGDDVRVLFRETGMDPDHSQVMRSVGLSPGDRMGTDLYPQLWPRAAAPAG